jgi:hypothetical protein
METERIDGTDYVVGSPEHAMAKRLQSDRMDAAYLEAHAPRVQNLTRELAAFFDRHGLRMDANNTAFLARDLVFVRREIEMVIYERLRAAEFVPVDTNIPRGAQTVAQRVMDQRGTAKISHTLAGDHPRADVNLTEVLAKFVNITGSYGYDLQELEYAAFAGVQLSRDKAMACAEMIARGLDQVGRIGDAATGLTGFFNNPNVAVVTLTNGEWLTATADEIIADLAQIEQAAIAQARDSYAPEVLVLPTAYEGRLATLQRSSGSDKSVKQWFLENARLIKRIERYYALDSASGTDITAADGPEGILYAKDPQVIRWPVPISYEEEAPQQRGFEFVVPARARCSGVDVKRPLSMLYVENLD